jgi:hypothetical protein
VKETFHAISQQLKLTNYDFSITKLCYNGNTKKEEEGFFPKINLQERV